MRSAFFTLGFAALAALYGCSGTSDVTISDDQPVTEQQGGPTDDKRVDTTSEHGRDDETPAPGDTTKGDGGTPGDNGPTKPPTAKPMTFFVTSAAGPKGGDLGGLTGADKRCQDLATAAGGGAKTWHAYLSTAGIGAVNARDRIGAGPWFNQKGEAVASSVADLHAKGFNGGRVLDEKGASPPDRPHNDVFTGSDKDGNGVLANCGNWALSTANIGSATVGHADASATRGGTDRWNTAHTVSCGAGADVRLYCFAIN
jgi:hypothetical protein